MHEYNGATDLTVHASRRQEQAGLCGHGWHVLLRFSPLPAGPLVTSVSESPLRRDWAGGPSASESALGRGPTSRPLGHGPTSGRSGCGLQRTLTGIAGSRQPGWARLHSARKAGEVVRRQENMHKFRCPSALEFFFAVVTLTVSMQAGSGPSGDCR